MRRLFGILAMALLLVPLPARADELTLRDVIELHRSGLGDDLLIAVIDADGGPFRLSFADIQDLKSDGLSERLIAALVRTGLRSPAVVEGLGEEGAVYEDAPPVVQVIQEVVTFVVVETTGSRHEHHRRAGGDDQRRRSRHDAESRRQETPPATWVTRQQDGKNVSASGVVVSSRPAASWVTPRDPKAAETPDVGRPRPR